MPFVSKATGIQLAKMATKVMLGEKLKDLDPWSKRKEGFYSVKEAVFPFNRFPNVDVMLGPEMRSTGEVMGMDYTPGLAFMKAQLGAGIKLPLEGTVFISVKDRDKEAILPTARNFENLDSRFWLLAEPLTTSLKTESPPRRFLRLTKVARTLLTTSRTETSTF